MKNDIAIPASLIHYLLSKPPGDFEGFIFRSQHGKARIPEPLLQLLIPFFEWLYGLEVFNLTPLLVLSLRCSEYLHTADVSNGISIKIKGISFFFSKNICSTSF